MFTTPLDRYSDIYHTIVKIYMRNADELWMEDRYFTAIEWSVDIDIWHTTINSWQLSPIQDVEISNTDVNHAKLLTFLIPPVAQRLYVSVSNLYMPVLT